MPLRLIAKLDVKPPFVVKPVHFEGLRKIGLPAELGEKYYLQGADEIIYIDIVASLYRREILYPHIEEISDELLIPLGVGGGVRCLDDFSKLFHHGADKVILNTFALQENPGIISEAAKVFGSQSVVVNIEAKRHGRYWDCYSDCGRIPSGRSVLDWVLEIQQRGAGEIIIQSVDSDGRRRGFDLALCSEVISHSKVPVVAASGAGKKEDVLEVVSECNPSAVAVSSILHYDQATVIDLKNYLKEKGVDVS